MKDANFAGDVLVLLGHGTEKNAQSSAPVFQHAAELRRRRIFREVREAFWKQEPQVESVLAALGAPRIFLIPLFISEGYFASQIIPKALGFDAARVLPHPAGTRYYGLPVGTHERMTEIILARAAEVTRQFPFPREPKPAETTLFLAGHGTMQNAQSRQAIEQAVERIRQQRRFADVQAVYMEEAPRIADAPALAQTKHCVVVPFFISDGLHVVEDIPVLLGEPERSVRARLEAGQPTWRNPTERQGKLFWYAASVGSAPGVAEVILERVREMISEPAR